AVADSVENVADGNNAIVAGNPPIMGVELMGLDIGKGSMAAENPDGINNNDDEERHKFELIVQSQEMAGSVVSRDKTQSPRYEVEGQQKSASATSDGAASPTLSITRPGRIQRLAFLPKVQIGPSNKLADEIDIVEDASGLLEREPTRTQCGLISPSKEKKLSRQPRKNLVEDILQLRLSKRALGMKRKREKIGGDNSSLEVIQ
ncbi:hypothetical protein Ancab_016746, partial [Ancistrocladus abbreviatus]